MYEEQLAELYSYIEWIKSVLEAKANLDDD